MQNNIFHSNDIDTFFFQGKHGTYYLVPFILFSYKYNHIVYSYIYIYKTKYKIIKTIIECTTTGKL